MESILLNEVSAHEFDTFFSQLNWRQRSDFVRAHRSEIAKLSQADILLRLCQYGYYSALCPLIKTAYQGADEMVMEYYAPTPKRWKSYPSYDEEKEILKFAAQHLDIIKFLREKTNKLWDFSSKFLYSTIIYEAASPDVINYLVRWTCRNSVPLTIKQAEFMFSKAHPDVIRKYLMSVCSIYGNKGYVSYVHLKNLAVRTDIDADDKHELLLLAVNRLKVRTQIIHDLRVDGLLDF